jgi:ABC-2 type transport system ATP-binding protein
MHAIAAESLSKTYVSGLSSRRQVKALDKVSLQVDRGEIFALLGPNGAGKTTFLRILLSLVRPTSGKASMLGAEIPNTAVRGRIGFLPENHRFPMFLTGEHVLRFFGKLGGVPRSTLDQRIPVLLDLVGMSQWRSMKVRTYSKGMLQRLGLAQAMINDPELLFLDEPTDGVDPVGRKEIRDILRTLKEQGKTIFLNSHLLSEVEAISDRVAILDKGVLVRTGTVSELTVSEDRYVILSAAPPPAAFWTEASALVLGVSPTAEGLDAKVSSVGDLNRIIDLLRTHGVEITGLARKRSSLEESFLSLIRPGGQA